jgi:DNA replication protein DnaC
MSSIDSVAQKYRSLHLSAQGLEQMLEQAEANAVSYLHFAKMLVERELQQRNGKRIEQNKRRASFPVHKSLDEFDYAFQTSISKREVNSLLDFGFIDNRENVVFIGSPGVGKTHLAIG